LTGIALCALEAGGTPGQVLEVPWVPSLDLSLSFLVDGLSLFFGSVVAGMGVLIGWYAQFYLGEKSPHQGRFYAYLLGFMGAMLGSVFANHLLLLFVFWELTGVMSFLLIGFLHSEEKSQRGARMAFLVTSGTALVMLAGFIMVGQTLGTMELDKIMAALRRAELPAESGISLSVALGLILVGALGKSAQWPFHFWLPNAMSAPTPVSAYLHSATMVKLGVFLVARFFPLGVGNEVWAPTLGILCFGTMLLGAWLALVSHDLKAILAWSTVSQLGFLMGYYGLGAAGGVEYDFLHILNHVFYKGCLFMVVGIVDHACGTRDIRLLGGLARRMPWMALACAAAAAAMAGVPGTLGFLSKETMLKEVLAVMGPHEIIGWYAMLCVLVTSIFKVAFSARLFFHVFWGAETETVRNHWHAPSVGMKLPPLLLGGALLVFGFFPGLLDPLLNGWSVPGLHVEATRHLHVWHGWTLELAVSAGIVAVGGLVYLALAEGRWARTHPSAWLTWDCYYDRLIGGIMRFAKAVPSLLGADRAAHFTFVVVGVWVALIGGWLMAVVWTERWAPWFGVAEFAAEFDLWRASVAGMVALGVVGTLCLKRPTAQIIALSVAGFMTCVLFVLLRAPDLALTQILVETVTLIVVLLLLGRFPRAAAHEAETAGKSAPWRVPRIVLATLAGLVMCLTTMLMTSVRPVDPMGFSLLEASRPLAAGNNAVNTILVDFRGFDTLGEITVLVVAMLGCLGLLMRYRRSPEERARGPHGAPGMGLHHGPVEQEPPHA
jgi:multicomponent K+:H+ antiporter subunit A/multicomponent Na+:H+ antiporter subunit A